MRTLIALAGAAALVAFTGCDPSSLDPTAKHDYSCTANFGGTSACTQLHITEVEGNAADVYCSNGPGDTPAGLSGTWAYHACSSTNRVPGYCQVDSASQYSLSGTPARVYFYDPVTAIAAEAACGTGSGTWVP